MDIHEVPGITPEELAKAHEMDVATQKKYGVEYRKYFLNHECGKVFCLVDAPSAEAAEQVHREAHGFVADKIIEVQPAELAEAFLGGGKVINGAVMLPERGSDKIDPAVRTVIFTDIVDSTALTQQLGDEKAMEFLHAHDSVVRGALAATNGREVKHTGDGIMASFSSAVAAMRCAARIQRELARSEGTDLPVKVRIGGAAGEPVDHGNDIFGSTVQLAARLCSHASPDQIVVSNVVAELCVGKGILFQPLGEVSLKGFDRPVQVHAVDWTQTAIA
jgi:class 3 adenylate cyclase